MGRWQPRSAPRHRRGGGVSGSLGGGDERGAPARAAEPGTASWRRPHGSRRRPPCAAQPATSLALRLQCVSRTRPRNCATGPAVALLASAEPFESPSICTPTHACTNTEERREHRSHPATVSPTLEDRPSTEQARFACRRHSLSAIPRSSARLPTRPAARRPALRRT